MTTSAFLANNRALIGTALAQLPASGKYPSSDSYLYWPGTESAKTWPSGDLNSYNRHKEMWGARDPQIVRLYQNNPSATTGITGSAGAYGLIEPDWRAIANDGCFLHITFKISAAGPSGWQTFANDLNSSTDNAAKQTVRNIAQNIRRWVDDTGNTATVKKLLVGFHHEPENDGGTTAAYIACVRAIIDYMARRGVHDASLSPITLGRVALDINISPGGAVSSAYDCVEWSHVGMGWQASDFNYWPGDAYCKWCFMDPYNWGGAQSSPDTVTSGGAGQGRVLQPGDQSGGNYGKAWNEIKIPCAPMITWSDSHPDVLLGVAEFGCSEYVDRFTGGNSATLTNPKTLTAKPAAKGEWYRQVARYANGLASSPGVDSVNAFTAEPRATRIKVWEYWNDQAAMPRWFNTIPFQPNDVSGPSTSGADRSLSYDGFVAMVNDDLFDDLIGGEVVPPTSVTLTYVAGSGGLSYSFTSSAVAGSAAVTSFTFVYGDGTAGETVSDDGPVTVNHTFQAEGTYNVSVTATQSDGGATVRQITVFVVDNDVQPDIEPLSGALLLKSGIRVRMLRPVYNAAITALANFVQERTTRRAIKTVTGTTYTLAADDAGKLIEFTAATAVTVTIPPNSAVPNPIGAYSDLAQMGDGPISVVEGSGVDIASAGSPETTAKFAQLRVLQTSVLDRWLVTGQVADEGTPTDPGGGGGGGGTTDDLFIVDLNAGPNAAALSMTDWDAHFGTDATYSNDAIEGAFAGHFNTAAASSYYRQDIGSQDLGWFAFYIKLTAIPAANVVIAQWDNGATKVGDLRITTSGAVQIRDNSTAVITSTALLTAGAWSRVAFRVQPTAGGGGGQHQLRVYNGADLHTTSPTFNGTGAATANAQAAIDTIRFGVLSAATIAYKIDRLRGNSTVEPSPIGA